MLKLGGLLIFLGGLSLLAFRLIGSNVDSDGTLHEPFALLPLGFLLLIVGIIMAVTGLVRRKRHNTR
ncbi:DUF3955 domain-containing protein [Microbulbifer sp. GL-2]|uniref:DUF3955 domain-containing protein n=1 Tax=Microbulbifer sp. GL-2 TaxID=2591606 RepID=UPI001164C34E|nr:hypothetical protein GL2_26420 [Microbulbifer sp. GL-2]